MSRRRTLEVVVVIVVVVVVSGGPQVEICIQTDVCVCLSVFDMILINSTYKLVLLLHFELVDSPVERSLASPSFVRV